MAISPTTNNGMAFSSLLMNALPGMYLVLLPDAPSFTIAAVSDEYLLAFGIQRESMVGSTLFEVFFRDGRDEPIATQLRQSLSQVIQTQRIHAMADQRHQWPDGQTGELVWRTWRPVNKPILDTNGAVIYIIHMIEDISHVVQHVEITEANRYLQTLINLMKEPLQVLQPILDDGQIIDFRFKFTNQAYAAYANATPQQLQGKRVGEVFPGYFKTESFTNPVETYTTGKPLTFEIHYDKDGLDLYNLMSTFKLDDDVVIYFTDFTQLRQLQLQLESKIEELHRSNKHLEQFTYIASHDLQEPLRKIQSFSSLLTSQPDGQLTETSRDYLQRIGQASSRMSTLITDLLAYSRLSIHSQQFNPVSLADIVADVLTTLDWAISQSDAQLVIHPLPLVTGDASQLGQLFQNLLSNALKFRRPYQRPRIEVRSELRPRNELPLTVKPNSPATLYHQISVCDEGIGFDEKYKDQIFHVFQRLHGKNQYGGTGIGLAICQQVVNNHSGAITATSKPGEGATFWVYLPALC